MTMKQIAITNRLSCSQLVLGSMMLREEDMDYSAGLMDAFTAIGGNCIDTAHVYGASSSRAVGHWIRERNNRSDVIIIGKGAHPNSESRMTVEYMEQDLYETFERMQTDYVDIFMLHRDDLDKSVGYIMESMNAQLEAGRCRALGVSNWSVSRIQEANEYTAAHQLHGLLCNSPNLSLAKPNEPRWAGCVSVYSDELAWHERTQLPLMSWSSQAGGFFTGRYTPDSGDPELIRVYYNDANWERFRRAEALAQTRGVTTNDIALAYVLNQPFPICALIGPVTVEELHSSAHALGVSLTRSETRWLDLME
ncbi:aldo/keto reductase [Cohnella sp. WQ 127256]|uniref:aldo/keto reductase n=1 Tax=Cohnella sp. WQ 127256 TaxID=2938790 RepID=UPI0021195765|nr:aldo/keto reductase [Cohnella sp. WQ 127256]